MRCANLGGMKMLHHFITQNGTTQAKLAEAIGVSRGYMSELVGGTKTPSLETAFAIERATNGAVPAYSWIEGAEISALDHREVS